MKHIFTFLWLVALCLGQTTLRVNGAGSSGVSYVGPTSGLPGSCNIGELAFVTDATATQRLYASYQSPCAWETEGGSGGSMVYPGAGVANSTGSAWGTSYTVGTTGSNLCCVLSSGALPAVSAANLTSFPTLNQNTTGSAAKWTTARNLAGNSVDGSANVTFSNKFIVQGTSDAGLTAAQFLGALGTGLLKNTTSTGVLTIGVSADVIALFSGTCSSSTFLRGDGACAAAGGSGSPGGSNTQIQYNNSGAFGGASGLTTDGTNLAMAGYADYAAISTPATPGASTVRTFGRDIAHRILMAEMGPSGLDTALQPLLARNKVGYWNPPGNATTVPGVFGLTALSGSGSATTRTVATTNLANRMRRLGYPSSATAGSLGGARIAAAQFSGGSGSQDGSGFMMIERFVESDPATVSGRREFAGMCNSTSAPTNIEPNTLTNCIGILQLSTDATQYYWYQSGSSAGTAVAIGTGIGAPAGNSTTAWELAIFAPATTANTFYVQLTNLSTGVVATTTFTGSATALPQSSTLLAWRHWITNNGTALATGVDFCSIYFETDF